MSDSQVPLCPQVIKNLLFVGKVIYLVSPESDVISTQVEVKEEEEEGEQRENGHEEHEDEEGREEKEKEEEEEEEDDKDDRPPSLLWLIKKLSLMAKREAAYTPKVPLKVHIESPSYMSSFLLASDYIQTLTYLNLLESYVTNSQCCNS